MANIRLTANEDRFVQAMNNAAGSVGRLSAMLNVNLAHAMRETDTITRNFQQGFGRLGDRIQSVGQSMTTYLTLPLALVAGSALNAYGELDSLKKGLLSIEGTSSNVEKRLVELAEAAKLPGLGFQEAIQGDVRLRSVGIAAETSLRILKEFGNAAALTGGGKAELSQIIAQLTQMAAKGKVAAQDLKPVIEAAPSVATAIKQMFGTVDSEGIQKQLAAAGKSSAQFISDLLDALEKTPRVTGGFKNAMENVGDSLFRFAAGIGESLDKSFDLSGKLNALSDKLAQLSEWFKGLSPEIQQFIFGIAGVVAVVGPLMVAVGSAIKGFALLFTGTLALTAAISAVVLVISGAIYLFADYQAVQNKVANATKSLADVENEARKSIHEQSLAISAQKEILENTNSTLDERKKAVKALVAISPEYFGKLDAEKIKYDDLNVAVSKYISNLENAAKANLLKSQIDLSVKTETEILANPAISTSEVEKTIGYTKQKLMTGVQSIMKGLGADDSQVDFTNSLADKVALNAAQSIIKIRDARKPLEEELKKLLELGYKANTGNSGSGGNGKNGGSGSSIISPDKRNKYEVDEEMKKAVDNIIKEWQKARDVLGKIDLKTHLTEEVHALQKLTNKEDYSKKTSWVDEMLAAGKRLTAEMPKILSQLDLSKARLTIEEQIRKNVTDRAAFALSELQTKMGEMVAEFKLNAVVDLGAGIGEAIGSAIAGGGFDLSKVFSGILTQLGDFMINLGKQLLVYGKLFEAAKLLFKANPIAGGIAMIVGGGIIKGLASAAFSQTPKFAQGGMVTGPTYAMMGDNASGREMALPWEKTSVFADAIASRMGGGGGFADGQIVQVLKGEDLHLIYQRYNRRTAN